MTKKHLFPLLLTTLLFISCKKELEPQDSSGTPDAAAVQTAAPATPAPAAVPTTTTISPEQATAAKTEPAKVLPGMNQPHGQPGHRCEIAVGAPLSSAPKKGVAAQANPTTITPTQANPSSPTAAAPAILNPNTPATPTAPGMNPPHGQEGHVCSVAVGAPLPKS